MSLVIYRNFCRCSPYSLRLGTLRFYFPSGLEDLSVKKFMQ